MNEIKYPEETIWWVTTQNNNVIGWGINKPQQVTKSLFEFTKYNNEEDWLAYLLSHGINPFPDPPEY